MLNRDKEPTSIGTLEYATPRFDPKKTWPLKWKIAILVLASFAIGILILMLDGDIAAPAAIYGVSILTILIVASISRATGSMKMVLSEVEEGRLRRNRETHKQEMEEIARNAHAKGPVGTWRFADVEYPKRGVPIVHEERIVTFETNGEGQYIWRNRGEKSIETLFEYKLESTGILVVQIISPPIEGGSQVEFGVGLSRGKNGEFALILRVKSGNSPPPDARAHWPFWGEFQRSAE